MKEFGNDQSDKPRMAWGLADISRSTGLSVNFLRYEIRRGNLCVKRFGRRVLVRAEDLKAYIENGSSGAKTDPVRTEG